MKKQLAQIGVKIRRQIGKDYILFPLLTGPAAIETAKANAIANLSRNLWSYMIIFCGHFPDGALHFTEEEIEDETRAEWYLRQVLGSANFTGGPLLHVMSGNLGYQIEHHLFPDLPSNRYAEISDRVRPLMREVRHPLHDGTAAQAVRPGAAHDHQAVAAQQVHQARPARRTRRARGAARPSSRRRAPDAPHRDRRLDLAGDCVIDQPAGGLDMTRGDLPFASMGDLGLDKRGCRSARSAGSAACAATASRGRWPSSAARGGRPQRVPLPARPTAACAERALAALGPGQRRTGPPLSARGMGDGDDLGFRVHPAHAEPRTDDRCSHRTRSSRRACV